MNNFLRNIKLAFSAKARAQYVNSTIADDNSKDQAVNTAKQRQNQINGVGHKKSIIKGDFSSDSVVNLAWQSKEAVIGYGVWLSVAKMVTALQAGNTLEAEIQAENIATWNYSAGNVSPSGNLIPKFKDEEILAIVDKVLVKNEQAALPDVIVSVMARRAGKTLEDYKMEIEAQAKEDALKHEKVRDDALNLFVGRTSEGNCEAFLPVGTVIDKIDQQMTWMCKRWKDKSKVATELVLMEGDILSLEGDKLPEHQQNASHEQGILRADAFAHEDKGARKIGNVDKQAKGYEPDALEEAFAEAEQEVVYQEKLSARRRVRSA